MSGKTVIFPIKGMRKKILGITAEYDPFHNGHKYHLETAKAMLDPDVSICVMSGDVTQRGELAVLDKWNRARLALTQGLDLVLELPLVFACSPAECFARGAVDILVKAGTSHIAFGCEAEDPEKLLELARLQIREAEAIEEAARVEMKDGISHVKARQIASSRILGQELTELSLAPNNILALEYLKRIEAWHEKGKDIEALPILRKGAGYKEAPSVEMDGSGSESSEAAKGFGKGSIAGGSAIREMIRAGWDVSGFLPYEESCDWIDLPAACEEMLQQLKGMILRTDVTELAKIRFVGEGIENKLIKEIPQATTYEELLKCMTSRRYTSSTIRRILICMLLGLNRELAEGIAGKVAVLDGSDVDSPYYGRILALGEAGRRLISSEPGLTFVANVNRTGGLSDLGKKSLELDIRAADLYNLLTGRDAQEYSDHRQKPYVEQGNDNR